MMKSIHGIWGTVVVTLLIVGNAGAAIGQRGEGSKTQPKITLDNLPRIDSSTSAQPLAMLTACKVAGESHWWHTLHDGSRRLMAGKNGEIGNRIPLKKKDRLQKIYQRVHTSGTHGAYVQLITCRAAKALPEAQTDFIFVAREPSTDELKLATEHGVELDVRPIAYDAFVFMVHADSPVNGLTLDKIRQIYTGKIKNWKEVGGKDAPIKAYQRNRNSGSQELMDKLVMKDLTMVPAPDMVSMSMMGPFNRLNNDPNGLGYTVYFYEKFMAPRRNPSFKRGQTQHKRAQYVRKVLAIDGIVPNSETIRSGAYSLRTKVYIVTRKALDPNHRAVHLRNWLLGAEGRKVIIESGYVPLK